MPRYKKASDGQWPGYPHLRINDIETLTIRQNQYVSKAMVNNRKGHIVLLMNHELYNDFLTKVQERKGNSSAHNVNAAVLEAVQDWIKRKK
ncbi:MAG: hypothetical protein ACFFCB_04640 [Candidatus Odinarchaeota archaeon]